jgi:uncharacterized RDD family membrane protein YckC
MERSIDIATGESVAFSYELAGLGSRFFAVFIDMAIQLAVFFGVVIGLATIGSRYGNAKAPTLTKIETAVMEALIVIAIFLLFFGYFIIFEWLWEGRTPGKRLLGLRVIRDGGVALDFTSSAIRNCVRIVELILGFYAISAVSALLSPRNQRLGDYAAGTLVVRDNAYERRRVIAPRSNDERDDPLTRDLSSDERELVRRYVERRDSLTPESRDALATRIATAIRPKLGASYAHLSDDTLLVHLAETSLA